MKVRSSQKAHSPLQSSSFIPSGPRLVSPMSLAEFWISVVVSVLMLLPGAQARSCGSASVAPVDSVAGIAAQLSCTGPHWDLAGRI